MRSFRDKLIAYVKAGYPAVAVQSSEEVRVVGECVEAARATGKGFAYWTATEGLFIADAAAVKKAAKATVPDMKGVPDTVEPTAVFAKEVGEKLENTVTVFCDFQLYQFDREPPSFVRAFRDFVAAPQSGRTLVLVGATWTSPSNVEKLITMLDFDLPDRDALTRIVKGIAESAGVNFPATDDLISALSGLSTTEAENALALSLVEVKKFEPSVVYREKVQAVKRSGLLEIIDPDPRGLDGVGGFDEFKTWITLRKRAFTKEAQAYGLPAPKGVLVCGVPGTGKSLVAKAIGTALNVPIVRLDIGALFGSLVGESERKTREALALAGAVAPCVMWVS